MEPVDKRLSVRKKKGRMGLGWYVACTRCQIDVYVGTWATGMNNANYHKNVWCPKFREGRFELA